MELQDGFTWAWAVWIGMFVVIEGSALKNKLSGDTLTAHIKKWAATKDKPQGWRFRRYGLIAFLLWLPLHFFGVGPF